MSIRLFTFIVAVGLSTVALGQGKPRIEKAADLPRFTYKIDGRVEAFLNRPLEGDWP